MRRRLVCILIITHVEEGHQGGASNWRGGGSGETIWSKPSLPPPPALLWSTLPSVLGPPMPSASAPRPKSYHMFSVSRREGLVLEQVDRPGGDVVLDRACHLEQVGGRGLRVGVGDGLQDLVACAIQVPSQSRVCSYNSPVGDGLMFPFESESTCGSKSLCTTTPDTGTLMRCILRAL